MSKKNVYGKSNNHSRRRKSYKYQLGGIAILFFVVLAIGVSLWKIKMVNSSPEPPMDMIGKTINHTKQNTEEYSDLLLVNKWNAVPQNYKPDLVRIEGGEKVDKQIYEPLMKMLEDAKEINWDEMPKVVSGYRSKEKQKKLYDNKIKEFEQEGFSKEEAVEQAELWVARPGYSEHELGYAVDINGATYDLYFWLQENSYKYGFIFRYPGDKTDITGISEEVWHYRYVGVDTATEIYEQGICLEEYIENQDGDKL